ncbi:hypothetical protein F5Y16DRAFT_381743 [Xylariaceae sp. FL0255]|nr:hypothetical protein F5Y16DRAFT_381743 [Xylariaceae sp. FL0255]
MMPVIQTQKYGKPRNATISSYLNLSVSSHPSDSSLSLSLLAVPFGSLPIFYIKMTLLTELPLEILDHILGFVDPADLAWLPRTCRTLYNVVTHNSALFKLVYLNHLDVPPSAASVDYEQSLKDLVRLQVICRRDSVDAKKSELDFVHQTVTSLLGNAATESEGEGKSAHLPASRNADILTDIFAIESNKSAFLCRSFIYNRARAEFHSRLNEIVFDSSRKTEHQKSAHLHCLYGVPQLSAYPSAIRQTRYNKMSPFACSKVYDLRQYNMENKWGPFMDDGTMDVDWEKVEAVMIVIGANMAGLPSSPMYEGFCSIPFAGTWPGSWKDGRLSSSSPGSPLLHSPGSPPDTQPSASLLDERDPYGVSGLWLRVVCFLDYNDFSAHNFTDEEVLPLHVPRRIIHFSEATRLIFMRIFVTAIEPPGPEDGQDLPVVHFKGVSRSLDRSFDENANSDLRGIALVRGSVRLTPAGEVRWTTFSIFGGVERWRSESVQVGGVGSAKGVLGHWFDKNYDPRGPAGPTAFWKVQNPEKSNSDSEIQQRWLDRLNDSIEFIEDDETHLFLYEDDEEDEELGSEDDTTLPSTHTTL